MERRVRQLRNRLRMAQQEFAGAFGIPANSVRRYEIGRYMPEPAVRAYLKVIEAGPEMVRRIMTQPAHEPAMS
ncbi:helix-turn-helix domain-containing protein [Novosphingobium sp. BL-52-GroH]|uniref:helix-turn-helix domain-containing protein n=1 Tax=Novosphingobium sp. BL-52-GroH TaxID=3349877 RepID=UPI00384E2D2D